MSNRCRCCFRRGGWLSFNRTIETETIYLINIVDIQAPLKYDKYIIKIKNKLYDEIRITHARTHHSYVKIRRTFKNSRSFVRPIRLLLLRSHIVYNEWNIRTLWFLEIIERQLLLYRLKFKIKLVNLPEGRLSCLILLRIQL